MQLSWCCSLGVVQSAEGTQRCCAKLDMYVASSEQSLATVHLHVRELSSSNALVLHICSVVLKRQAALAGQL